jgi:hypothetical protein
MDPDSGSMPWVSTRDGDVVRVDVGHVGEEVQKLADGLVAEVCAGAAGVYGGDLSREREYGWAEEVDATVEGA